ncbi:MAG TPA: cysteine rich repeat-containing protein [Pseudolabrys sp.]|nr:cysteine rich repeat-containing protein [Pseudolabrys sp.]
MNVVSVKAATVAVLISTFPLLVGNASAQTPVAENAKARIAAAVSKIKAGCGDDVAKFCGSVTPGEGRLILCMMAHEDKLSAKCDYTLYDASRNLDRALALIEQAADVCWPDIEKHCANIPEGGGHIAQCLVAKKESVASDCRTALDQFPGVQ